MEGSKGRSSRQTRVTHPLPDSVPVTPGPKTRLRDVLPRTRLDGPRPPGLGRSGRLFCGVVVPADVVGLHGDCHRSTPVLPHLSGSDSQPTLRLDDPCGHAFGVGPTRTHRTHTCTQEAPRDNSERTGGSTGPYAPRRRHTCTRHRAGRTRSRTGEGHGRPVGREPPKTGVTGRCTGLQTCTVHPRSPGRCLGARRLTPFPGGRGGHDPGAPRLPSNRRSG